ncbi:MAG TPA: PAS domain-containing protein [Gammaproteobacteria bacterium]|nr:PAS domain-containing protein [Gammaproteobacteria bacterium]
MKDNCVLDNLQANQKKLNPDTILSGMPQNIWAIKECGEILYINHYAAKILGFNSPKELIGKNVYDVTLNNKADLKQVEVIKKNDQEVLAETKPILFKEEICINGERFCFLSYKKAIDVGKGKGVMGVAVDITGAIRRTVSVNIIEEGASSIKDYFSKPGD